MLLSVGQHLSHIGQSFVTGCLALCPVEHVVFEVLQARLGGTGPGRGLVGGILFGLTAPLVGHLCLVGSNDLQKRGKAL